MSAYAYVRVSTEDQQERRAGIAAQIHACQLAAAPAPVVEVFPDEAVSGATPLIRRPALLRALGVLTRGDILIVAKRDRLGRDPIEVALIEREVQRKGARVLSCAGEGTGGDTPSDILMRRLIDAFAEYERRVIRSRTSAALQAKKRAGERVGAIPYGFRLGGDGVRLLRLPAEQKVISRAVRLRREGLSLRAIAEQLQVEGALSRSGRPFAPEQIRRMLEQAAREMGERAHDPAPIRTLPRT